MSSRALTRNSTPLLGIATLVPAAALLVSLVEIAVRLSGIAATQGAVDAATFGSVAASAMGTALFGLIVSIPLALFYVWHVQARARIDNKAGKMTWVVLLVLAAPFAMPAYWYSHVHFSPSLIEAQAAR